MSWMNVNYWNVRLVTIICLLNGAKCALPPAGFYQVTTYPKGTATATCGSIAGYSTYGCNCPVAGGAFTSDFTVFEHQSLYGNMEKCSFVISGKDPWVIFHRFDTQPIWDFVRISPCANNVCSVLNEDTNNQYIDFFFWQGAH